MTPARLRSVVAVLVAVGVAGWAVLDAREASGAAALPTPWTAAAAIALLAVAVLVSGLEVRRWVAGRREHPMDPLVAARIAVMAKAAAYTGGALAGWYLAQAVVVVPDLVGTRRARLIVALICALAAVGLAAAGLLVQVWCRRPRRDDEDDAAASDGGRGVG